MKFGGGLGIQGEFGSGEGGEVGMLQILGTHVGNFQRAN